jgi:hypothetical protein
MLVGLAGTTAVAVGVLIAGSVTVGGTAVAIGSVVVIVESGVGGIAVSGSAAQAANKRKKHPQTYSTRVMNGIEHI